VKRLWSRCWRFVVAMFLFQPTRVWAAMDNKQIARILWETAQLLEIDGAIIGRYCSYNKAAELFRHHRRRVPYLARGRSGGI
jgi:hypothetical protein